MEYTDVNQIDLGDVKPTYFQPICSCNYGAAAHAFAPFRVRRVCGLNRAATSLRQRHRPRALVPPHPRMVCTSSDRKLSLEESPSETITFGVRAGNASCRDNFLVRLSQPIVPLSFKIFAFLVRQRRSSRPHLWRIMCAKLDRKLRTDLSK